MSYRWNHTTWSSPRLASFAWEGHCVLCVWHHMKDSHNHPLCHSCSIFPVSPTKFCSCLLPKKFSTLMPERPFCKVNLILNSTSVPWCGNQFLPHASDLSSCVASSGSASLTHPIYPSCWSSCRSLHRTCLVLNDRTGWLSVHLSHYAVTSRRTWPWSPLYTQCLGCLTDNKDIFVEWIKCL